MWPWCEGLIVTIIGETRPCQEEAGMSQGRTEDSPTIGQMGTRPCCQPWKDLARVASRGTIVTFFAGVPGKEVLVPRRWLLEGEPHQVSRGTSLRLCWGFKVRNLSED